MPVAPTTDVRPLGQSGYGGVVMNDVQLSRVSGAAPPRIAVTGRQNSSWSFAFQTVTAPSAMAVSTAANNRALSSMSSPRRRRTPAAPVASVGCPHRRRTLRSPTGRCVRAAVQLPDGLDLREVSEVLGVGVEGRRRTGVELGGRVQGDRGDAAEPRRRERARKPGGVGRHCPGSSPSSERSRSHPGRRPSGGR